jgi:hypothetical protein
MKNKESFKREIKKIHLLVVLAIWAFSSHAQLIKDSKTLADIKLMFEKQQQMASGRKHELFDVFNNPLTTDEKQALEYLYAYMP